MRPTQEEIIRAMQGGIMAHYLPELQSQYAKAQFAFGMVLFSILQKDFDGIAQDLVDANAALRSLLAEIGGALSPLDRDDARSARDAIAVLPPPAASVRLSDLRAEHDALRGAVAGMAPLIEAAADVPELATLRDVRLKLYALLSADAQRRTVPILG
jgi:hypothetical protein